MISLEHLQIVQDAAEIELAMWNGRDKNLYQSAMQKLKWVRAQMDELSLDSDQCPMCEGKGKSTEGEECELCFGNGYIELDI